MIRSNSTRKLALTAHVGQVYKLTGCRFSTQKSLEERNLACINNISDDYKFAIIIAPPLPLIMGQGVEQSSAVKESNVNSCCKAAAATPMTLVSQCLAGIEVLGVETS